MKGRINLPGALVSIGFGAFILSVMGIGTWAAEGLGDENLVIGLVIFGCSIVIFATGVILQRKRKEFLNKK
jgi:hypothetical protein